MIFFKPHQHVDKQCKNFTTGNIILKTQQNFQQGFTNIFFEIN